MAGHAHGSRHHPGGHSVNPAEVSVTLDGVIARITIDVKDGPERARSLIGSNRQPAHGIEREANELVRQDAFKVNRERTTRCRIGHD
jgi:hypothetical protein